MSERIKSRWRHTILHMERLISIDAPNTVKAHFFVSVLIPRLAALCGVEEFTGELANILSRGLVGYVGMCLFCKKVDAIEGEELCPDCKKEYEQFEKEVEAESPTDKYLEE